MLAAIMITVMIIITVTLRMSFPIHTPTGEVWSFF